MAIRNTVASAVLGLLFLSLVAIYLLFPQNGLVTFLCILILIVSLLVAQTRRWRDIAIMAIFAAIISLVAASLFGRLRFGDFGAVVLPLVWAGILLFLFNWTQRNMLAVPKDRAILIRNNYNGAMHVAEGPMAPPLIPGVESKMAIIPLYELSDDVQVKKVNTKRFNVELIDVHVHYSVVDARRALSGIPNRGQAQHEIAEKMGKKLNDARLEVTFWERLLNRQMRIEVEDIVRDVLYDNVYAQNPMEVYQKRDDLAEAVGERLSKQVQRWGVKISGLRFENVEVLPEVLKSLNKANIREDETLQKEIEAKREAMRIKLLGDARSVIEADRVRALVNALKETGVNLSPDVLREIVIDAIYASGEVNMEMPRPLLEAPAPRLTSGTKDDGKK